MRTSLFLTSVLITAALASPIDSREQKRDVTTATISEIQRLYAVGTPVAPAGSPPTDAPALSSETDLSEDDPDTDEATTDSQLEKRTLIAKTYWRAAVMRHNLHRANHGAGRVTWNHALAAAAMVSAKRCTFDHFMGENGLNYGQNLAIGQPASDIAGIITDQWYAEENNFGSDYGQSQPNMNNFGSWGHFTQVVWRSSSQIGCASWHCPSVATNKYDSTPLSPAFGNVVTYCNYAGAGNFANEYAANVGLPRNPGLVAAGYQVDQSAIAANYARSTGYS